MNRVESELLSRAFIAAIVGLQVHEGSFGMAAFTFTCAVLAFCGSVE